MALLQHTAAWRGDQPHFVSFHWFFIIVMLPHTPNPWRGDQPHFVSFHWLIYLLLSCLSTPPTPYQWQAGLKGRSTTLRFIPLVFYYCHASAHPQPRAVGRQAWRGNQPHFG